jgi:tetratricopeptide (TPR) repeat protein
MKMKKINPPSWFYPLFIFMVAFLQYVNTISADYAWDDKLVITGNDYTRKGIHGLHDIFTKRVSVPYKNVYRPVPQAMFAIEYDLFHQNPHYSHLFNVIWYAILCVLIFYFIKLLFPQYHLALAFTASLLFAVHPLHVEVVANIKSRDEILAFLFGLGSIILLLKAARQNGWFLVLAAFCFILAVLSKENVITLLPVAVFSLWFSRKDLHKPNLLLIFVVLTLGILLFWWTSRNISGAGQTDAVRLDATVLNNVFLWTKNASEIIPTAIINIGRYLLLFIYPHPLIHLYGYNQISLEGWGSYKVWCVILIVIVAAWFVWKNFKKKSPSVFGIIFFIITYSVYSNFLVLAPDTMADRYLFIPSLGLALIAADILIYFIKLLQKPGEFRFINSKLAIGLFSALIIGFFIRTFVANQDWENDYTLIYNRIKYMPDNAAAQATYGYMLDQESMGLEDRDERQRKKGQAMEAFRRSVEIYPDFEMPWISMGRIFAQQGVYDKAELCFLKAMVVGPPDAETYFCLGSLAYTVGDGAMATSYLEKTVLMNQSMEKAYILLGRSYLQVDSISHLGAMVSTAVKWFPDSGDITALMAIYCYRTGQLKEASTFLDKALQLDPRNISALSLRSVIQQGRTTDPH